MGLGLGFGDLAFFFSTEASSLTWDVHMLILGTLEAGEAKLSLDVDNELADVKAAIKKYGPSERLSDDYVEALQMHSEQIRFLYNSALVSLVSRLYEALRNMADYAALVVPPAGTRQYRNGKFGPRGDFIELFNEYHSRFAMFDSDTTPIDFVGPMVAARNRIVHHGSRAYKTKDGLVDETSADHFKQYVKGTGWGAGVEVTGELLDANVQASAKLAEFVAEELRRFVKTRLPQH